MYIKREAIEIVSLSQSLLQVITWNKREQYLLHEIITADFTTKLKWDKNGYNYNLRLTLDAATESE